MTEKKISKFSGTVLLRYPAANDAMMHPGKPRSLISAEAYTPALLKEPAADVWGSNFGVSILNFEEVDGGLGL